MKKENQERIKNIIGRYPRKQSAVLPIMQHLQKENKNYLNASRMEDAGRAVGMNINRNKSNTIINTPR